MAVLRNILRLAVYVNSTVYVRKVKGGRNKTKITKNNNLI